MVPREIEPRFRAALKAFPAVTLTGPRQAGKSTLCRSIEPELPYCNLEALDTRGFAQSDPRGFLAQFPKGAILDEVQRVPELASYLQGIIDADSTPGRWILTGSQNLAVIEEVNQSLAGRTAVLHLLPLSRSEVVGFPSHPTTLNATIFTGGYPRILDRALDPSQWLQSYVATYIERDVRMLSNVGDLVAFQRFVELCASRTGQLLNYSSLASDCSVSQPTAKAWLSLLEASFVTMRVPAFHTNARKRLMKMPKLHFIDTGLACWLLGIRSHEQLQTHPLRGPLFESWVVSEIAKHRLNAGEPIGLHHYREHNGAEADLVIDRGGILTVVEAKSAATATPALLAGAMKAREYLGIEAPVSHTIVVYGGGTSQRRSGLDVVPWCDLHKFAWR